MTRQAIYVDASYGDGVAGLAITGALGARLRAINIATSNDAEIEGMAWAISLVHAEKRATHVSVDLAYVIYTDSLAVLGAFQHLAGEHDQLIKVEWVDRRTMGGHGGADRLANMARKTLPVEWTDLLR